MTGIEGGRKKVWRVVGRDGFDGSYYGVSDHDTEEEAREAVRIRMAEIERKQPNAGGPPPHGIQDVVWAVGPDDD